MAKAIICDIDDTLIHDGQRNDAVYEYAKGLGGTFILVTGRSIDDEEATKQELKTLGIEYDELWCNDFAPAATIEFKKSKAKKLLETYEIDLAIDNDKNAREAYASLGIKTLDPADIPGYQDNQANQDHPAPEGKSNKMTEWTTQTRAVRIETRAAETNTFEGRACQYGVVDSYGTTFASGCFTKGGLDTNTYALLWQHDPTRPIGTFHAEEREDGLYIVGRWDENQAGQEARTAALSGSASDLSVGFTWAAENSSLIEEARLMEVSQVTTRFGAVPGSVLTAVRTAVLAEAMNGIAIGEDNEAALKAAAELINSVLASKIILEEEETQEDMGNLDDLDGELVGGTVEAEEAETEEAAARARKIKALLIRARIL